MFSLGLRCWTVAPSRSWTVLSLYCKTRRVLSTRWCKRWARLRQRLCWSQQEGEVKKSPLKHGWKICIHTVSMLSSLWQQPEQNNLDFSVAATTRWGLLPTSLSHTQTEVKLWRGVKHWNQLNSCSNLWAPRAPPASNCVQRLGRLMFFMLWSYLICVCF